MPLFFRVPRYKTNKKKKKKKSERGKKGKETRKKGGNPCTYKETVISMR